MARAFALRLRIRIIASALNWRQRRKTRFKAEHLRQVGAKCGKCHQRRTDDSPATSQFPKCLGGSPKAKTPCTNFLESLRGILHESSPLWRQSSHALRKTHSPRGVKIRLNVFSREAQRARLLRVSVNTEFRSTWSF